MIKSSVRSNKTVGEFAPGSISDFHRAYKRQAAAFAVITVMLLMGLGALAQTNFCKAILAKTSITLSGNMLVDSFNSMEPSHSTNGRYDPSKREDGADIGSISDAVTVITDNGNTSVYGHFATGPAGKAVINGNASVGSLSWVDGGNRGIQPGWYITNLQAVVPDATLPNITFSNFKQTSGTVNGTNYSYVLTSGNYQSASSLTLGGNMCINGNVVLYLQGGLQISGQNFIYIAPGAHLTVYLGASSKLSGGGAVNATGWATNCAFIGLPGCLTFTCTGSSDFIGTIYAPSAAVSLSGGGSRLVNFAGSLVAGSVSISGSYDFHYDQSLCTGCSAPVILTPPADQTKCAGSTATFNVAASGSDLAYQWYKGTNLLAGKTARSLSLSNLTTADAGTYKVTVSVPCGNSVSKTANLSVSSSVTATPLTDMVRSVGGTAIFSTTASGSGPFTFSWQKNGSILAGQTTSSLTLTNLAVTNSGTYAVTASGPCNSASSSATLTVDTCFPAVDVVLVLDRSGSMAGQPYLDAKLAVTNFLRNLHFTNNADKASLVSYNSSATLDQILTNNESILEKTVQNLPAANGYTSISAGLQTAQNELVSIRHNPLALPVIVLLSDGNPTSSDTPSNAIYTASLAKNAGTRIFTVGFGSVTPSTLTSIASSPGDAYIGTNSSQLSALFNAVSTIICRPPTNIVANGPSNQTVCAGSTVTFSVAASGCSAFSYQWEKNGVRLAGETHSSLSLANVTTNSAGLYAVEVISTCRSLTNSAVLVVTPSPTIACSSNKTVQLGAPWTFDPPTANYSITILSTVTNVAGHCGNTFDATRTWATIDPCGNSSQCSQTVNIVDTTAPVINCASTNKLVQLGTPWTFDPPTATDISSNVTITIISTVTNTAGHCGNTFSATRTWAAIDPCGNSSQCSQTVNLVDTTAPVINCASTNKTVQLGTAWSFDAPTATDVSSNVTITIISTVTNTTGHCGSTFDATRTWAAIDACGNSSQCSQTVNIVDTTAPVINCASTNKTVQLGTAWSFDAPTATDISSNVSITILSTVTNTAGHCGNTFDVTRTWAAIDACGNSSQCSQTVNIVDTTAPVINCASTNKTVQLGTAWSFDAPTATDISSNVSITILSTVTNTAGHCGSTFDATRTWAAIDACGNSSQCSQTVNVVDTTAPVINCASTNKTVQLGNAWTFDAPTATDISSNVTITIISTVTNTTGHCGNTFDATRTWAAIDACGNSSQCSQTVNIVDTTAPVINCASTNKTVQLGTAWSFDAPTATDISSNVTITIIGTVTNTTGHCGNTFDATRTWAAIDACGNSSQCSQTVNIVDTTAPVINCASTNKTVQLGAAWSFDAPTATDISSNVTITIIGTVTNTTGHCGNTFDATRTWAAIDACGNSSQCSQTVNIVDTTAPVINCASTNKTVQLGAAWSFDAPTATDISSNVTITIIGTVTNTTGHCGSTFEATRTWAAIDACGNSSQCSQTVNIVDTTAPVINCASTNKTVQLGAAWSFDAPTATDISSNVTITIISTVTNTAGHCGSTFDATRTWAAIDACGNSSQCSQTVNIVDTTAPVINCASTNKTVQLGTAWTFDAPTAADNSTNVTMTIISTVTNTIGHCGSAFDATRTWAAIDACGNSSQCSQMVNVADPNPIHISVAPVSQTNCAGTPTSFSITASGTGLTYAWFFSGRVVGTGSVLTLGPVAVTNTGTYTVIVTDQCGANATNSAILQVRTATSASPLSSVFKNLGDTVTFTTVASGVGPFTFVWRKDGQVILTAHTNSLTLTNLTFADAAVYTVEVTGACNTDTQSATLTVNHPPTVTIINPTNGAAFIAPASFTLAANAFDSDGFVTNVEFYLFNTNKFAETTNSAPATTILTNLPVGTYTFTAAATDNLGARGTSAPVTITVILEPPLTVIAALHLNLQTGLYEQTVRVSNPTYNNFDAIRVYISNLNAGTTVYNATGTTNGTPYVESHAVIPSGGHADFVIEYYIPSRILPNPTLHAQLILPSQGGSTAADGQQIRIDRGLFLSDNSFMVEFLTVSNRVYVVEYSADMITWKNAQPAVIGNGTRIQWIDAGEPKTESAPSRSVSRFYRVILLP